MDTTLAVDFTRIGLICDFIAFFLAAPEILGENGMLKIQGYLRIMLIWLSVALILVSLLGALSLLFAWIIIPLLALVPAALTIADVGEPMPSNNIIVGYLFFGFGSAVLSWIPRKLMKAVERLSNNGQFRRQLLNFGIVLFVFGSIAQIIGTF